MLLQSEVFVLFIGSTPQADGHDSVEFRGVQNCRWMHISFVKQKPVEFTFLEADGPDGLRGQLLRDGQLLIAPIGTVQMRVPSLRFATEWDVAERLSQQLRWGAVFWVLDESECFVGEFMPGLVEVRPHNQIIYELWDPLKRRKRTKKQNDEVLAAWGDDEEREETAEPG